ncbi:MAG: efflux transporter periplasmic adaptor subunit [Bacteroidetes bacterium]|nr:efflux transporter periplasmic adaptor subunit [Bacteroidota bacterium]
MRHYLYNMLQAVALIAILSFILSMLSACNGKANVAGAWDPNAAVAVATQEVKLQEASYNDVYPGTVVALNQIELRAQVSGFVTAIFFKDGDHVTKGQQLYSIDPQLYAANYDQAKANLGVQETNLVKAQKDADRYHELAKSDAIAKQQVDYADAALDAAKKQVDAAKAAVNGVQTNVKYATITAPFDGTIGISQVKVGTAVTQGQTLLNTVSTDDPMAVDFAIDQKEIYRFAKLEKGAKKGDSTFLIVFNKTDVYPSAGKLSFLDRAVDPQTGTLKVRIEFPNRDKVLRAGMSCDMRVNNSSPKPVILIPYKAVTEQLGEYFAYTANGDVVSQHKITLGTHIGTDVIVLDGLKEHDMVVTEGVQKLHEGSKIVTGGVQPAKAEKK